MFVISAGKGKTFTMRGWTTIFLMVFTGATRSFIAKAIIQSGLSSPSVWRYGVVGAGTQAVTQQSHPDSSAGPLRVHGLTSAVSSESS